MEILYLYMLRTYTNIMGGPFVWIGKAVVREGLRGQVIPLSLNVCTHKINTMHQVIN